MPKSSSVLWLSEITPDHHPQVGLKATNLGLLTNLGMPVPNGFVLSNQIFQQFLTETRLATKLPAILKKAKNDKARQLQDAAEAIQQLIMYVDMPESISQQIIHNYHQLATKDALVAVRQSLIGDASINAMGSQTSFLNVVGPKQLELAIKQTWASLFQAKAIYYRNEQKSDHLQVGCAIIIQRMVEAESSGISFSLDPLSQDPNQVTIEAVWGLGEPISTGQITPDYYHVDKTDWNISQKDIVRQEWQLARSANKPSQNPADNNTRIPVSVAWQRKQKLQDRLIVELARLTVRLDEQLGGPQQVEWTYADHTLFIVQSEPIQWLGSPLLIGPSQVVVANSTAQAPNATPLLIGTPAAPGVVSGKVKIIRKPADINKLKASSVAVFDEADMQDQPNWTPPVAIISNQGGRTADAALLARQLGIPAVLGVVNGTKMLKDGEIVTVDGTAGAIYEGDLGIKTTAVTITAANAHLRQYDGQNPTPVATPKHLDYKTATKVMVNIAEPDDVEAIAAKNVDGVGLLRSEYLINSIGRHPQWFIDKHKEDSFVEALTKQVMAVAKAFGSRPIIYRLSDLNTHQYQQLEYGSDYETTEANPALGYHGAYRHSHNGDQLKLELQAVKKARQYHKNIWLMVPFVRTPDELIEIKHYMSQLSLHRGSTLKLFMMVEVPANVILIDQFIGVGLDGVSIGSNDLTQLLLGTDRHNPQVAAQFDERNEAVMWALKKTITSAAEHGIMSSICGQAPSVYPELTKHLVEWGITSISVSPEAAAATRRLVADAEYELVRQGKSLKNKK